MKREIIFSKNAEKSLIDLLEYLELKWSLKVREKFISKLDKFIFLIQNEPEINQNLKLTKITTDAFYQSKLLFTINIILDRLTF